MKMKTKTMTRWLAMVLCVLTLFSILMPAVNAAETDAETPDESAEVTSEVEAAEEASPTPDSTDDENEFVISHVVAALSNASAVGAMNCWEDTDYTVVERNTSVKLRSSGATVMSVPAGESIYLQRGGYVSYGNYVTDFYSVWMGESALAHEGDKNYACAAFCACPSMSGPNTGHYSGAAVQRMNSDADTNYTTLNVFKAVILTSPYGPLAEYHQSFWNVIEPDLAATNKMFATVHAILGYLYDPGSHGTPYRWDAAMQSTILGSGGLLEQIINWANANPDALSQAYVYRLKGSESGLQDLVWMNAVPKYPMYLKKVSSNPTLTDNNSKYSLGGAVYTVYSDAACTKSVGTLTTGDNGVSGYLYVKEGTYYAKETTAPKGFELNPDVIGPVSVSASNQPGIFNATDVPKPTSGNGKLVKQSANPDITNGNTYYTLEGAEYTVYSDQKLTKSEGVLKTDKNGSSNTLSLDAGTYYVKETKAPNGFKLDSTVHSMVIKENETTTLTVKDSYIPSNVTLKKVSSNNGVDGNENYSLAGAVYDVFSDKNLKNKVGSLTTKADGTANSITVPAGTYYAKEVTAPKGFKLNDEVYSITVKPGETGIFQASDTPATGYGKLQKRSANPDVTDSNSFYSLEGAEYTVYTDQKLTKTVGTLKTDKDGNSNVLDLFAGTYYVKETKAPAGFELDETVHTLTVKVNETTVLKVEDEYIPGKVTLKKVSADTKVTDGNENYSLAGAVYDVFSDKDLKNKVGSLTTKEDGSTNSITVPAGSYYAKEVTAPKGYKLSTEVYSVTVKPGETGTFRASDVPEMGTVSLLKSSIVKDCGISLVGAEYSVYSDAECKNEVAKLVTDKDGKSDSITVPYGSYYAKETKAPKGYELNPAVIGPVTVNTEHKTGVFKAEDTPIPTIRTTASVDGVQVAKPDGAVTLVDTVHCKNLVIGKSYSLHATLMDRATGEAIQIDGKDITADKEFKAEKSNCDIEVVFEVPDASILESKVTVVFESLSRDGKELTTHADLNDEGQTIWWPSIGTTATIDGEHSAKAEGPIDLVDTVQFTSLQPGKEYTLTGTLMDKTTGEAITDAEGNVITATQKFTPDTENGTVEITFHIEDSTILRGKATVVFESVYYEDREVAIHADISDEDQSVYTPEIGTTATINGEHEVARDRELTLVDVVAYRGLEPGKEYTVKGVLMDAKTGEPFMQDEKEVTAEIVFTPDASSGVVELSFTFDSSVLKEDTTLVAFESLSYGEKELAVHADLNDAGQTVIIKVPTMHTTATINGKKEATTSEKLTLEDVVSYTNLVVGKEYVVKGKLMDKSTGKPYLVNGKEVTAETTFKPEAPDGEVKVTFEFDGSGITTKTSLVVFESMYEGDLEILVHADIEDSDQTVTIDKPGTPQTGDTAPTQLIILGVLALMCGAVFLIAYLRGRKRD